MLQQKVKNDGTTFTLHASIVILRLQQSFSYEVPVWERPLRQSISVRLRLLWILLPSQRRSKIVSVDQADSKGRTALHYAFMADSYEHFELMQYFLY